MKTFRLSWSQGDWEDIARIEYNSMDEVILSGSINSLDTLIGELSENACYLIKDGDEYRIGSHSTLFRGGVTGDHISLYKWVEGIANWEKVEE